jgi:hypothetical protein
MKLSFPLFAISLILLEGFSQSTDLKYLSLPKPKGIDGDVEKEGQDLALSKAITNGTLSANGSVNNNRIARRLSAQNWQLGGGIDGGVCLDYSGESVALSGDGKILAAGAGDNDGGNGPDSGHVRIFKWKNGAWVQLGDDIDEEKAYGHFGRSALSQDARIVAVRIFKWKNGAWVQIGDGIDAETDGTITWETNANPRNPIWIFL